MPGDSPDRVWLFAEQAHDPAAELLRTTGAEVTVTVACDRPIDGGCTDPHAVVVIATSARGRALVDQVIGVTGDAGIGRARTAEAGAEASQPTSLVICEGAGVHGLRALLRAGVRGVVLRDQLSQALLPALAAVASGLVCLPGEALTAPRRPVLSMREKQVVGLVAMGLMNAQIADRLFLAESTVKSHLSSAFAKLGVRSRHEAVEVLLNPASGWGLGILSLDEKAIPAGSEVADLE